MLLREKFPQLAEAQGRERQATIDFATRLMKKTDSEARTSGSASSKPTSINVPTSSPTQQRYQRKMSGEAGADTQSPKVRPKTSMADLIFRMDEDEEVEGTDATGSGSVVFDQTLRPSVGVYARADKRNERIRHDDDNGRLSTIADSVIISPSANQGHIPGLSPIDRPFDRSPGETSPLVGSSSSANKAWGATVFAPQKLDMKDIMAQTPSKRSSSLSTGLSAQPKNQITHGGTYGGKLSQKERKKQQQQQQQRVQSITQQPTTISQSPIPKEKPVSSPWKTPNTGQRVSLKDVFSLEKDAQEAGPSHLSSIPGQHNVTPANFQARVAQEPASVDAPQTQQRSTSSLIITQPGRTIHSSNSSTLEGTMRSRINLPIQNPPRRAATLADPPLQLSMVDIISQQQAEQDMVKQVVAKRPLHEIQQEQEFMEWWDAESKKVREGEEAEKERNKRSEDVTEQGRRGGGRGRGCGRGRGRGGGGGGRKRRGSSHAVADDNKAAMGKKSNGARAVAAEGKQKDKA